MKSGNIELIVDEPIPGHYYWVLLKQDSPEEYPKPIDYAAGPMPSYSTAMMAGIAALQKRNETHGSDQQPPVVTVYAEQGRSKDFSTAATRH